MPTQEFWSQLGSEMLKLSISGVLGGFVAHFLSIRLFKTQKRLDAKYELHKKKLDALRDIITTLHWLSRDILDNKEKLLIKGQDELMIELVDKLNYWETLFLDDKVMWDTLEKLDVLVYISKDTSSGKDKMPTTTLLQTINEIKMIVKSKIIELQNL